VSQPRPRSAAPPTINVVPRLHVNTGAYCNNNCLFCAEDDRAGRARMIGGQRPDDYLEIMAEFPYRDHLCFTTGEPTLNPLLPWLVRSAAELGYREVALITNGRRLGDEAYLGRLLDAGLNVVTISIHGGAPKLHDGLTRTRGSFAQTLRGLRAATSRVRLHTSTVITLRNLPHLHALLALLGRVGVDQAVLNVAKPRGRAHERAAKLLARYDEVARAVGEELGRLGELAPPLFLEDVPRCATGGLPDVVRGVLEHNFRYDLVDQGGDQRFEEFDRIRTEGGLRTKRAECASCPDEPSCPGVWSRYIEVHGWTGLGPPGAVTRRR
jgi:MoaA/NifB/PqqE/SkfB family radical SAM enzyme